MKSNIINKIKHYAVNAKMQIKSDLSLKETSSNIQCPFPDHEDETPSAQWNNDHIYCHNCDKCYDIINHYVEFYNHSVPQAIIELCQELKIDIASSDFKPPLNYLKTKTFKAAPQDYVKGYQNTMVTEFSGDHKFFTDKKIDPQVARDFFGTEITNDEILMHHHEFNGHQWVNCHTKRRKLNCGLFDDGSKEKSIYGGFSCFFGLKTIAGPKATKSIIFICEGHSDALRLASEIAKDNALNNYGILSVPNGSGSLRNAIENSPSFRKYIKSNACQQIIIVPDADNGGHHLLQQAQKYLNNSAKMDAKLRWYDLTRLASIKFTEKKGKDLSDALDILGGNYLHILANYEHLPIDLFVADIVSQTENGYRTGMATMDYNNGGIKLGTVWASAGIRGQGKTSLMRQIMTNLAHQKIPIYSFFGEGSNEKHKRDLQLAITNEDERYIEVELDGDGKEMTFPKQVAIDRYNTEYGPYIKMFDKVVPEGMTLFDALLQKMKVMAQRGTCIFFIDNMMQLTEATNSKQVLIEQKRVMTELTKFAETYNVHIHIIMHLNKGGETITGAYEQENLVDTILFFQRIDLSDDPTKYRDRLVKKFGISKEESELVTAMVFVKKIRDRGTYYTSLLTWDNDTGRAIDLVYERKLNRIATHYVELGFDCIKASTLDTPIDHFDSKEHLEQIKNNQAIPVENLSKNQQSPQQPEKQQSLDMDKSYGHISNEPVVDVKPEPEKPKPTAEPESNRVLTEEEQGWKDFIPDEGNEDTR